MTYSVAVIDTNVVVAGLLTANTSSPTARIFDGMRGGAFRFLLSTALLAEYREVLLRRKIRAQHGLTERDVDALLTVIAANAIVREPEARSGAPDTKDDHLWSLLQSQPGSVLVTGDLALIKKPPEGSAAIQPREFVTSIPGSQGNRVPEKIHEIHGVRPKKSTGSDPKNPRGQTPRKGPSNQSARMSF